VDAAVLNADGGGAAAMIEPASAVSGAYDEPPRLALGGEKVETGAAAMVVGARPADRPAVRPAAPDDGVEPPALAIAEAVLEAAGALGAAAAAA
jgi:hypothetical protein